MVVETSVPIWLTYWYEAMREGCKADAVVLPRVSSAVSEDLRHALAARRISRLLSLGLPPYGSQALGHALHYCESRGRTGTTRRVVAARVLTAARRMQIAAQSAAWSSARADEWSPRAVAWAARAATWTAWMAALRAASLSLRREILPRASAQAAVWAVRATVWADESVSWVNAYKLQWVDLSLVLA